ncbi:MAG: hypothetical protein RBR01_08120 [Desulfobacterales bacterium]|nr:hypothetical protein [Desulfobacterales bacterium]
MVPPHAIAHSSGLTSQGFSREDYFPLRVEQAPLSDPASSAPRAQASYVQAERA